MKLIDFSAILLNISKDEGDILFMSNTYYVRWNHLLRGKIRSFRYYIVNDITNFLNITVMSQRCIHCGHYNTEYSILGNLEYVAKGLARGTTVIGGALGGGIFMGKIGAFYAGKVAYDATKNWTNSVHRYHCNACGQDF